MDGEGRSASYSGDSGRSGDPVMEFGMNLFIYTKRKSIYICSAQFRNLRNLEIAQIPKLCGTYTPRGNASISCMMAAGRSKLQGREPSKEISFSFRGLGGCLTVEAFLLTFQFWCSTLDGEFDDIWCILEDFCCLSVAHPFQIQTIHHQQNIT